MLRISTKILVVITSLLLCVGFTTLVMVGPGIESPTAVAPYINGNFPSTPPQAPTGYSTTNAFPNITLNSPFKIIKDPRGDRFFVAEKRGRISIFSTANGGSNYQTVVDFQDSVSQGGGTHGLMGFVLHPEFGQPGSPNRNYFYVFYRYIPPGVPLTSENESYRRLSRFELTDGTNVAPKESEFVMIHQFVRSRIHSGGGMDFDKNGFLLLGIGDGGNCCEVESTQRLDKWLLGGIIRIDVDKRGGDSSHPIRRQPVNYSDNNTNFPPNWIDSYSQGYFIPNDNPWQDPSGGTLEEFYALGLRHAYTVVYDEERDEVWEGDIGQSTWEEINKIEKGANYEWPYLEATRVHNGGVLNSIDGLSPRTIDDVVGPRRGPHIQLNRATSNSVIAGLVYRGSKFPGLQGKFLFADHGRGNIYTVEDNSQPGMTQDDIDFLANVPNTSMGFGIASFATDEAGEIYIVKLDGVSVNPDNREGGTIHKIIPTGGTTEPPALLSETGAFSSLLTLTPTPGIIPYSVNSPLWSDGASKKRWIALPNDGIHDSPAEQIEFDPENPWKFPEGTVLIKHFELPVDERNPSIVRKLETRFTIFGPNDSFYGVTYKWNEAQTDAVLLVGGESESIPVTQSNGSIRAQNWDFPSRTECLSCHTQVSGRALGVNTHQLNGDFTYPGSGITANQLETWNHLNMFTGSLADPSRYLSSVAINDDRATSSHKILSYLDANCGHCHRPGGVEGAFDGRMAIPFGSHNLVNMPVDGPNSVPGGVVVKPGSLEESELYIRDNKLGTNAMPPLAKNLIDQPYIEELGGWILDLQENTDTYPYIGEVGQVEAEENWVTVNLLRNYTQAVVMVGGISYLGGQVAYPRVRNVTSSSFQVKVEEWQCMDVNHLIEMVPYVVMEAGEYVLPNGKLLKAGVINGVTQEWINSAFPSPFAQAPVLLAQVSSFNEADPVNVRLDHSQSTGTDFRLRLQEDEGNNQVHAGELVSWMAVEPGIKPNGFAYEMDKAAQVNQEWKNVSFNQSYAYKPIFIGFAASFNEVDPIALRFDQASQTGNGLSIRIQEETCADAEETHAFETINYWVFERPGLIQGAEYSGALCTVPENLALNKPSKQSSTYGLGEARLANDGNGIGSSPWTADLQHTRSEQNPWWEVDLGQESELSQIILTNRTGGGLDRLKDFYVLTSSAPFDPTASLADHLNNNQLASTFFTGIAGAQVQMELNGLGRYVRIQLSGNSILHIAEVEVLGCPSGEDPCLDAEPVSITSAGPFVENSGTQTLSASPSGGIWGGEANPDGTFDPSNGPGSYAVSYTFTDGNGCTQIATAQIEVEEAPNEACGNAQNLALGKPSRQSSTYGNGDAQYANDGNKEGSSPWSADLQHTQTEPQPWWEVDLGAESQLDKVKIYNRTGGGLDRLKAFYVLVSTTPMNGSLNELLAEGSITSVFFSGEVGAEEILDISATGRYVRIQLSGTSILHMAEVEVLSCDSGGEDPCQAGNSQNLALGKAASQSSVYGNGVASIGVDGDRDGTRGPWGNASLIHTAREDQPWWQVDLGEASEIQEVIIHNRTDCCLDRLGNFYIFLSPNPIPSNASISTLLADGSIIASRFLGTAGVKETLSMNSSGRYVRIQLLAESQVLHFAELEVIGCPIGVSNQRFSQSLSRPEKEEIPTSTIFPNPAQSMLHIQVDNLQADAFVEYSLYNNTGQKVMNWLGKSTHKMGVAELSRGIYLLKIQSEDWIQVTQVVLY